MKRRRNSELESSSIRGGDSMLPGILEAVDRYVHGDMTLVDFEEWFVPTAWDVSSTAGEGSALHDLAAEIYLRIAENDLGHLPEAELKKSLAVAADKARTLV
jgi:hypothetical protein